MAISDLTPPVADETAAAIVLAAGRGTRMGSSMPKVLHPLNGRPMIEYVMSTLDELGFGSVAPRPTVVVGFGAGEVSAVLGPEVTLVHQRELLGTGNAALMGLKGLNGGVNRVLLVHGDEPLIGVETYAEMLRRQRTTGAAVILLTGSVSDTHGLGRVIRNSPGNITELVQERELDPDQPSVNEINFGAYVFDRHFMDEALPRLELHPVGEYYLTDLVRMATEAGRTVDSVPVPYPDDQMGINDPAQLQRAERFLCRMA